MIQISIKQIDQDNTCIMIKEDDSLIKFSLFLKLLKDEQFVNQLKNALLTPQYDYFFESSSITSLDDCFVIVLSKTIFTNNIIDTSTYSEYLKKCNAKKTMINFDSRSGNRLIIPCYASDKFTHIRNFIKYATDDLLYDFFLKLRKEAKSFLKINKIVYLKTHGLAVNYFHFRLQQNDYLYVTNSKQFSDLLKN